MARYLVIESGDPFDSWDSGYFADLAPGIKEVKQVEGCGG